MEGKLSQSLKDTSLLPTQLLGSQLGACQQTDFLFLVPPSPTEAGFLDDKVYDSTALGPGYDRPFQFDPSVREPKTIQLYKHLNLKSCVWTFDAYYDMTELIDVCGGSVTADFQVGPPGAYPKAASTWVPYEILFLPEALLLACCIWCPAPELG